MDRNELDQRRRLHDEWLAKKLASGKTTADLERERAENAAKQQAFDRQTAANKTIARKSPTREDFKDAGIPMLAVDYEAIDKAINEPFTGFNDVPEFVVPVGEAEQYTVLYHKETDGEIDARTIGGIPESDGIPSDGNADTDVPNQEGEVVSDQIVGEGTEQQGRESSPTDGGQSEQAPSIDQDEPSIG